MSIIIHLGLNSKFNLNSYQRWLKTEHLKLKIENYHSGFDG